MNPIRNLLLVAATFSMISILPGSETEEVAPAKVFIIDDQTGFEILQKHGISPIEGDDMIELINAAIMGKTPVRLFHQVVDEDASDNAVSQLIYQPYAGSPRPAWPEGQIPVHQFAALKKAYDTQRTRWQMEIGGYQRELVAATEVFIQRVGLVQIETAQRFDRMLEVRNGRDFSRSDVVGCLVAANRILGASGRRALVLSSDCVDLPGSREPRRTPLTAKELDPGVELIFVNTSRLPEQSILFAGLPNPTRHADSMKEAMRYLAGRINMEEESADSESGSIQPQPAAEPLTTAEP